ncbi:MULTISPECIES: urea amidolyase associated protein UAAP1 [unclassified Rhodococcus (in: high G+C Gram-positive bacteria)]|uniref:urea amidolyase associated protein UAAP1 n=1 Tax=unclassified Rhodococcus (in: high G+C Gram-positive bacteria) TaxID=192944 RepID=UPI00163A5BAB|nr:MULTISPECIES: urea amidolyase associated protein UAAP1 [unclassified Rhodococcus (in: high G+C Gram-positive bacteria)]MBC2644007.1 urea carboxylase-associated family protein [Rhodococcus sp. 3A]MBC2891254.1 urea carboxylase-associated family protein [Rhodococcus sp. 4CII]
MTSADTSTTTAAKEHARSQAGAITDSMPVVPASAWPTLPSGIDPARLTWAETVPGGRYTTKVLARGTRLRLRDLDGRACAHLLLYRADAPWERLNVADTVKVPWQAYTGAGHPLLSDQGRVLATVVSDGSGRHDALCGTTSLASNTAKYGDGSLHSASPAGRELLTVAAAKHGLARRDLPPSLSFFHGVRVGEDGSLRSIGSAGADTAVDLVIHLPVIVLIANTAHPLDPSPTYDTTALEVLAWSGADVAEPVDGDPEYRRAFLNTEDVWAAAQFQGRELA